MPFDIKKCLITFISICCLNFSTILHAEEYFDPFFLIRTTPEGKQLLDLEKNAEFDAQLAKQQLDVLNNTGVAELGVEYKVANILAYIAIYHGLSDYEKVEEYLNELHLIGVKKDNDWVLSKYFEQQGLLSIRKGHLLKGLEDVNKAIEIGEQLNYQRVVALATAKRATIHSRMGQSSKSLKDYNNALKFFEETIDLKETSLIYANLVVLYIYRKEYQIALEASDKSLEIQTLLPRKSHRMVSKNYINRAIVLSHVGTQEQELDAFTKAQEFAIKSNEVGILSSVYANLSDYYLRHENYELAIERAIKCIETAEKIKDIYVKSVCYLNYGLSSIYIGDVDKGFSLLNQALKIVEAEKMTPTLLDVYSSFIEGHQAIGEHEKANQWLEKRYEVLLKQAKDDKSNYFHEIEENFKETVAEREQLHSSFKSDMMDNILGQEALVKKLWITISALCAILLIFIFFIFKLKSKLKRKYYN
ncbi:MAG: tetratricopeptide repeat protein [Colwelliaceae bacterium]|nr:tetratricopeptide repeat protein [Colwelliaceae bacterium]